MSARGCSLLAVPAVFLLLFAAEPAQAQCGGLCIYEVGSPDNAMSAAGAAARAQDAATALFNPAGMTRLDGTHILLGTVLGFVDQKFDIDSGTTARGGGGGQVANFIPLGSAFLSAQVYEELRFGFSFAGLYGGGVDYDNNWAGRTWVTEASLAGLSLSPALAYPVTDWLSLGGAVNVTYFILDYQLKTSTALAAPTVELDDADDWAVSGTVSLLVEPREDTRIGLYYRTPLEATLSGKIDNPLPANPKFDLDFDLAQGVNVGVFHQLTPELALLGDAGWSDWSKFDFQALKIGPLGSVGGIPRNFKDTWRIGIGAQYQVLEDWLLRGGFSYDSSPVDAEDRLPDLPASEQYRFSTGFQRQAADNIVLGMSYTFLWMANNEIDNVTLPGETLAGGPVILDGEYDPSYLHFFGVSLGVNF